MYARRTAATVLDADYLKMRHELIGLAAALDRIDRANGSAAGDGRVEQLRRAAGVLLEDAPDRARRVQMVFSDSYP